MAGRNSDDAEQINDGLKELQAQWKTFEISTAQVCSIVPAWQQSQSSL